MWRSVLRRAGPRAGELRDSARSASGTWSKACASASARWPGAALPVRVNLDMPRDGRLPERVGVSGLLRGRRGARRTRPSTPTPEPSPSRPRIGGDVLSHHGPRRRRRRRRLCPGYRPGRPQRPGGGDRRPDLPRQSPRGGDQPARRASARPRRRRRHGTLATGKAAAASTRKKRRVTGPSGQLPAELR